MKSNENFLEVFDEKEL